MARDGPEAYHYSDHNPFDRYRDSSPECPRGRYDSVHNRSFSFRARSPSPGLSGAGHPHDNRKRSDRRTSTEQDQGRPGPYQRTSVYLPRPYSRNKSSNPDQSQYQGPGNVSRTRILGSPLMSSTAAPVRPGSNVWVSSDYKDKQRMLSSQKQRATESHNPQNASSEAGISAVETQRPTQPHLSNDAPAKPPLNRDSLVKMDPVSNNEAAGARKNTADAALPQNNVNAASDTANITQTPPTKPAAISTTTDTPEGPDDPLRNDMQHARKRPRSSGMKNTGTASKPSSPTIMFAQRPVPLPDPNADFYDLLSAFMGNSVRLVELQRDSEKAKTMYENKMKDLMLYHSNEEAAKKSADSMPELAHWVRKGQNVAGDISKYTEQGKLLAQQVFRCLVGSSGSTSQDVPGTAQRMFDIERQCNELKTRNEQLQNKVSQLETSQTRQINPTQLANSNQFAEVQCAIEELKNEIITLKADKIGMEVQLKEAEAQSVLQELKNEISTLKADKAMMESRLKNAEEKAEKQLHSIIENSELLGQHQTQAQISNRKHDEKVAQVLAQVQELKEQCETSVSTVLEDAKAFTRLSFENAEGLRPIIEFVTKTLRERVDELSVQVRTLDCNANSETISSEFSHLKAETTKTMSEFQSRLVHFQGSLSQIAAQLQARAQARYHQTSTPSGPNQQPPPIQPSSALIEDTASGHRNMEPSRPYQQAISSVQCAPTTQTISTTQGGPVSLSGSIVQVGNSIQQAWRIGKVTAPSHQQEPTVRELFTRILSVEQFVAAHEQRLNFTTLESIWPSLIRHVMDHIATHYRYPETIAQEVGKLQSDLKSNSETVAMCSQQILELKAKQPSPSLSAYQESMRMLEDKIKEGNASTSDAYKAAIKDAKEKSDARLHILQKELQERTQLSLCELREDIRKALEASRETDDSQSATASSDFLQSKFEELRADVRELEQSYVQDMTDLHGKIAKLSSEVKDHNPSSSIPPGAASSSRTGKIAAGSRVVDRSSRDSDESSDSIIEPSRNRKRRRT